MNGQVYWYVARSSGLVAWALVAASVVWGLAVSTRALGGHPAPAWLLDLHRFLGGLAVVFTGIHMAALVADSYTHFALADLLVPLASEWRPVAVAWGVVGLWLLLAIQVTSLLQRRLPRRLWRTVHRASLPLFVLVSVHAFTAGSEAGDRLMRWFAVGAGALTLFLRTYGKLVPRGAARGSRRAGAGAARAPRVRPAMRPAPPPGRPRPGQVPAPRGRRPQPPGVRSGPGLSP